MLTSLDVVRGSLPAAQVEKVRSRLAALLGTESQQSPVSVRYAARLDGQPFDQGRLDLLTGLVRSLRLTPPSPRPALGGAARWSWEPFFEAYFSNFIEGTEFGVEEARKIAIEGADYYDRPQDAHDVAATYHLVSDAHTSKVVPRSGAELIDLLRRYHATFMAARSEKQPGEFKSKPNYAGGYEFVSPELVEGTLMRGFDLLHGLTDPFQRAVAMMLLIAPMAAHLQPSPSTQLTRRSATHQPRHQPPGSVHLALTVAVGAW